MLECTIARTLCAVQALLLRNEMRPSSSLAAAWFRLFWFSYLLHILSYKWPQTTAPNFGVAAQGGWRAQTTTRKREHCKLIFSLVDASLACIRRRLRPRRVVKIGAGAPFENIGAPFENIETTARSVKMSPRV